MLSPLFLLSLFFGLVKLFTFLACIVKQEGCIREEFLSLSVYVDIKVHHYIILQKQPDLKVEGSSSCV